MVDRAKTVYLTLHFINKVLTQEIVRASVKLDGKAITVNNLNLNLANRNMKIL